MTTDGGYSEDRTPGDRAATWAAYWATVVPYIDGQQAAHEGARKQRAHRRLCDGCDFCESAAEALKEARDD